MKLFTRNSRLNFEEYIIRINHLAIHKTLIITCQKKGSAQHRVSWSIEGKTMYPARRRAALKVVNFLDSIEPDILSLISVSRDKKCDFP
jgi:hypothetical protein